MTLPPPIYDLVLLLDPQLEESARTKIVADARAAIEADGELLRDDSWGERALAYPIARKTSAEYHLLQFHAGSPRLLETLEHSLRIIDGILRFRLIKLKPGVPDAPDMRSSAPPRKADAEPGQEQPTTEAPAQQTGDAPAEVSSEASEASTPAEQTAEVEVGEHA
ncbi:MAG TPA: 30S ribosomal protein S6 [Solirubrobacteraceae bacterium]